MTPTYDEIRASARPCEGDCGRLVTAPLPSGGYYCRACASALEAWRVRLFGGGQF